MAGGPDDVSTPTQRAVDMARRLGQSSRRRLTSLTPSPPPPEDPAEPTGDGPFQQSIVVDYPVRPRPRFFHGGPVHPRLAERIGHRRRQYGEMLAGFVPVMDAFKPISLDAPSSPAEPYWANGYFSGLDAVSLYGMLARHDPPRYLEVGSGSSTKFARKAIVEHGLRTHITSIDPHPRAETDDICDRVVRQPLEDADLSVFNELEAGDVLFVDGSHRCFTNSDVAVFFVEVLPELPPGVLVHVHDIFLPYDYPDAWNDRYYSEQYLLAAMLLSDGGSTEIVLPNYFVTTDDELSHGLDTVWARPDMAGAERHGVSFWFRSSVMPP